MSTTTPSLFEANAGRGALLSDDGQYRYRLWRLWDDLAPVMVWVMLNPSTADADVDDPTIRKCIGFAKAHRHGGIIVVNLFAWRATDPKELAAVKDPVGPENDDHIRWACRGDLMDSSPRPTCSVVAGWGSNKFARQRALRVKAMIQCGGQEIRCFRRSTGGTPWHPLYLPYDSPMVHL